MSILLGTYDVRVSNGKARFRFTISRKITVVVGDSGTGKTKLCQSIAEFNSGAKGVQISCSVKCVALTYSRINWEEIITNTENAIFFIDESCVWIRSEDFASLVKWSDNYFVLFSREPLYELSYSVEEIYNIKTSNNISVFDRAYKFRPVQFVPECIVTEDGRSGYIYFTSIFNTATSKIFKANGKDNIINAIRDKKLDDKAILLVADGAAFGASIEKLQKF